MALSSEEAEFPLAFSIAMFTDVEQTERLLRAIYQPQNHYCIHVDTKSSLLIHRAIAAIARCFDNVWIATHLDKIKWGDVRSVHELHLFSPPSRYAEGLRPMSHLQFYRAIFSRNFIARQNGKCDMPSRALQLCRINKNRPISVHCIFATKLHRIERCSNRKRSCATVEKLSGTPCHTCDFVAR